MFWNDPAVLLAIFIGVLIANSLWTVYLMLREVKTDPLTMRVTLKCVCVYSNVS